MPGSKECRILGTESSMEGPCMELGHMEQKVRQRALSQRISRPPKELKLCSVGESGHGEGLSGK